MTTELYPWDILGAESQYDLTQDEFQEKRWLIEEIIKTELPNIIDNVEKCLEMLQSDDEFKMPISSGARQSSEPKPYIRGTITRQRDNIVDFQAIVQFPTFHKAKPVVLKMEQGNVFQLCQIHAIGEYFQQILYNLEELQVTTDVGQFTNQLGKVLNYLTKSISILQNPPKELAFPFNNNEAMKKMFGKHGASTETSSHHNMISFEILLFKNDLCVELRSLAKVTKKPWCDVSAGKSFTDLIKEDLKADRRKTLATVLKDRGIRVEEPTMLNNLLMSTFNTETTTLVQARNYLSRCVTFQDIVVMESEKLSVMTSDPSLISLTAKLNALEATISDHFTNLSL